jgi:hypothetical protein
MAGVWSARWTADRVIQASGAPDIHLGLGNVEAGTLLNVDVRWRGADGKMRSQILQLTPGRHTVWLGLKGSEGG